MKSKRSKLLSLALALALLLSLSLTVAARDVPDLTQRCSLTLSMMDGNIPLSGGTLTIYKVGDVKVDDGNYSFVPTARFAPSGETFADLTDNPGIAARLVSFIDKSGIPGLETQTVDKNGTVVFTNLDLGLYLVVQHTPAPGYEAIKPFLISLPSKEGGKYVYDLIAEPKTEPPSPTETEPTVTTTPGIPQTGQLWWPVPMLAFVGLLFVTGGTLMMRGKHED